MTYSDEDRVGDQIERVSGVRFAVKIIRAALERDPACCEFLSDRRYPALLVGGNQPKEHPLEPLITRAQRLRDALYAQGYPALAYTMPLTGSPDDEDVEG